MLGFMAVLALSCRAAGAQEIDEIQLLGQGNDLAGTAVASGNVNGDEYDDLLIGAVSGAPDGRTEAGRLYVVLGREDMPALSDIDLATMADLTVLGGMIRDKLGGAVASGDVNRDGFDDIIVTAYNADPDSLERPSRRNAGKVYVILGRGTLPAQIDLNTERADIEIWGASQEDVLGAAAASGDLNNDGIDDIVVSARDADPLGRINAGATFVFYGNDSWLAEDPVLEIDLGESDPDFEIFGKRRDDRSGQSLAIGNFNGDGYRDLLIGAAAASEDARHGEAYVVFGTEEIFGPESQISTIDLLTDASVTVRGNLAAPDNLGWSVASGNFNRDAYDDLLIGVPAADLNNQTDIGMTYVIYGKADFVSDIDLTSVAADLTILGDDHVYGSLGWAAIALNYNGDGFDDVLISAPFASPGGVSYAGEVYGIFGRPNFDLTIDLTVDTPDQIISGVDQNGSMGGSIASGDLDGNGVEELILGTPGFSGPGRVYVYFSKPPFLKVSVFDASTGSYADSVFLSYNDQISLVVKIDETSGMMVMEADFELAFNGDLLDFVDVQTSGMLSGPWTVNEKTVVLGGEGEVDRLVINATNPGDPLQDIGEFMQIDFQIRDIRQPTGGELNFEVLSFNGGRTDWNPVQLPEVILVGDDGQVAVTAVSEPGDILRMRVDDDDLDVNPDDLDEVVVTLLNSETQETQQVTLIETGNQSHIFYGEETTSIGGAFGSQVGDKWEISYIDLLNSAGQEATVVDTNWVLTLGDADGNGERQAYDAAQILRHALQLDELTGDLALAANVYLGDPITAPITSYDAALVIQRLLGRIGQFPVQEATSFNHPQPESASKLLPEVRQLALISEGDGFVVWAEEREGIIAGDLVVEGLEGTIEMAPELGHFQAGYRNAEDGMRVAFAGDHGVSGPGEMFRIMPTGGASEVQDLRGNFNGGQIAVRFQAQDVAVKPLQFALHPNAPNPFNAQTLIRFDLPTDQGVRLEVFNALGQMVRTLVDERVEAGVHQIHWDSRDDRGVAVGSGPYIYRLTAGSRVQTQRMLLLK